MKRTLTTRVLTLALLLFGFSESASATGYFQWFGSIYVAGPYPFQFTKVPNADVGTFKVLKFRDKDSVYGKDKQRVYYWESELKGADPVTFETIAPGYGRDIRYVYYFGEIIQKADPETFVVLSNYYGKDKTSAFRGTQAFIVKDLGSLEFPKELYRQVDPGFAINNELYIRDKYDYYYFNFHDVVTMNVVFPNSIEIVDLKSKWTEYANWLFDGSYWYCHGRRVPVTNPKTFKILNSAYSLDEQSVYFLDLVVVGADPSSFSVDDYGNASDKNHRYWRSEIK